MRAGVTKESSPKPPSGLLLRAADRLGDAQHAEGLIVLSGGLGHLAHLAWPAWAAVEAASLPQSAVLLPHQKLAAL